MSKIDISELGFTPVEKAPSQNTFNGIGTRLYGQTKVPQAEGLYTKVHYFTLLYVPVLALGKYLAHKQDGNEYILGKGRLSGRSKAWNGLVSLSVASFIGFGAYQSHVGSPEYEAKKMYSDALEMVEEHEFDEAITSLKSVYSSKSSVTQAAGQKLKELMSGDYLAQRSPAENFEIVSNATKLGALFPKRLETYKAKYDEFESVAPVVASDFAELVVNATSDEATIKLYENKNFTLLKGVYSADKSDYRVAQRYAVLDERLNQCLSCREILEPHLDSLANTEGSRILGQAYAAARETDKAYDLLAPYVDKKIKLYHAAEAKYDEVVQKVWDDTIELLNSGNAPASFYTKYDAVPEQEQDQLVDEFYAGKRDASAVVSNARDAYRETTSIVPVALDLGIVLLDKASVSSDGALRSKLLEQAEETFLSVQNYAGDSDDYQLYLGQVYYWLGKSLKGKSCSLRCSRSTIAAIKY